MRRIVAIQRASISGLRGLHPPTHLSDLNQRWIALLDQSADELDVTRGILLGRDSTLAAEYAVKAYTLSQRARALVASHGVTSCRAPQDLRLVSVS